MNNREVMQQALAALEQVRDANILKLELLPAYHETITALRTALEAEPQGDTDGNYGVNRVAAGSVKLVCDISNADALGLVRKSQETFERNFGQSAAADWIYADLTDLFATPQAPKLEAEPVAHTDWNLPSGVNWNVDIAGIPHGMPLYAPQAPKLESESKCDDQCKRLCAMEAALDAENEWQQVPKEPTAAMMLAFRDHASLHSVKEAYKKMLDAAPKPEPATIKELIALVMQSKEVLEYVNEYESPVTVRGALAQIEKKEAEPIINTSLFRPNPINAGHVCKFEKAIDLQTMESWQQCECGKMQKCGHPYYRNLKPETESKVDSSWPKIRMDISEEND